MCSLPLLGPESFNEATFRRLLRHVDKALEKIDQKWQSTLERDLIQAHNLHEVEQALVRSCNILHRRVVISQLLSWPEDIRQMLFRSTTDHINQLQQQLEQDFRTFSIRRSTVADSEVLLRLFRSNSLTAVLEPSFLRLTLS